MNGDTVKYFPRLRLSLMALRFPWRVDAALSGVKPRAVAIGCSCFKTSDRMVIGSMVVEGVKSWPFVDLRPRRRLQKVGGFGPLISKLDLGSSWAVSARWIWARWMSPSWSRRLAPLKLLRRPLFLRSEECKELSSDDLQVRGWHAADRGLG